MMIGDDGSLVIGGPNIKPPLSTKAAYSGLNFLKDNSQISSQRDRFASSNNLNTESPDENGPFR